MSSHNGDQNLEPPNDDGNPPTPANESTTGNSDRPTRSITVSIQYSYFNPNGLANLNRANGGADSEETPAVARPDGALILSFRDVPTSTPQERLESIISIAAELAMRRFSDLMSQPKGISKEQFEELPTVRISELQDEQSKVCSICYDSYEDEPENVLKRSRDEDFADRSDLFKKQRSESPAVMIGAEETAEDSGVQSSEGANDGETPTYKHAPVKLPCDHVFGRECLYKWSQLENSCPLCRHKIVDAAPGNSGNSENMANLNAEAFERIRQALYNNPQPETTQGAGSDPANETGDMGGNDLQNFSFSRSGIVLLRPDDLTGPTLGQQSNAADQGQGAASEDASAATNAGFNPFAASNGENRRIQWIPLPITTIYTGANNLDSDGRNSNTSGTNLDGSENATGRHQERTPNERLRAILSNIFNVSHSANTTRTNEDSGTPNASNNINSGRATATSTSDHQPRSNSPIPRRRSFLDHILRITHRHRNRQSNNGPRADTPPALHPANNMFNSGVASYRNQDGQVSTFNIAGGQLPSPRQANQQEHGTTDANSSETRTARPRSDSGESSSESNDTSS